MTTPDNAKQMFDEFKKKEKFLSQPYPDYYPGISEERLKPIFTEKINQAAEDFQKVAEDNDPTDKKYQAAMAKVWNDLRKCIWN